MSFVRGHFRRTRSGYAYVRPSLRGSGGSGALGIVLLVVIGVVVSVIMAIVRFVIEHWIYIAGSIAMGCAVATGVALSRQLRERRIAGYLRLASEAVDALDDRFEDLALARVARRIPSDDQRRTVGEEEIYRSFIARILADGQVSDEECAKLQRVHALFAFDSRQALAIREEAFDGFMSWVGVDISEAQEAAVRTVAARLELAPQRTETQLAVVTGRRLERERHALRVAEHERRQAAIAAEHGRRQAASAVEQERQDALEAQRERDARLAAMQQRQAVLEAKRQRQAELEIERGRAEHARQVQLEAQRVTACEVFDSAVRVPVIVSMKLKRDESCWLSVQARLRDRKVIRAGEFVVTNKRILFISDSVVSVTLPHLLDIAADPDSGTLRLIKDGRKTPYEFLLEQPLVALAHVERSLAEA
jgi:hypothetical protein